jgi:hypothetical protein
MVARCVNPGPSRIAMRCIRPTSAGFGPPLARLAGALTLLPVEQGALLGGSRICDPPSCAWTVLTGSSRIEGMGIYSEANLGGLRPAFFDFKRAPFLGPPVRVSGWPASSRDRRAAGARVRALFACPQPAEPALCKSVA